MKKTKSQFEQEAGVAMHLWGFQKVQGELIQGGHDFRSMQSASPCRNNCSEPGLLAACDMIFVPVQVLAP